MRAASSSLDFSRRFFYTGFAALGFVALGCAGGKPMVAVGSEINDPSAGSAVDGPDAAADAAASSDAGASAPDSAAQAESAPPAIDPAVAHALVAKSGDAAGPAPLGLRFEIIELGAELPWALAVVNRGTEAALVDFDARLLTLEIQAPTPEAKTDTKGKPLKPPKPAKPVLCRLPAGVLPSSVDSALLAKLEPGEGLVQNFDPRLYCVGKAPWPLVQGAQISARLGWPPKMKVSWHAGKREEKPGVQSEPFIAEPSEAEGSLPKAESPPSAEAGERRIKELIGTPLTLGSDFALEAALPAADSAPPPGLELTISGSDAADEGAVTATTTITNRGKKKEQIYFRRELITYEVSGPDGVFQCDPQPDRRSPADRSAVQTLANGGRLSAVSRLIEMCPAKAFARPGLYLVHARFDAADPATDLGFHAFMGRLVSKKPALVRVRQGELPFTPPTGAVRVHVGE
ncbi:MAG: hypothetical protein ABW061_14515 [Polyangiaceae bacterium]